MNLIDRATKILLQPKDEWLVINAEPTSIGALYSGYVAPLAAIGPVATAIGWSVFGMSLPLAGSYRIPAAVVVKFAVVQYVMALVGTFVLALIIDALAPTFAGQKNQIQALKVAAYSSTAAWVVGIVGLVPALGILAVLALYSLYLLYLGLPVLMKSPKEKAMGYTLVVIIAAVVLYVILGAITTRFALRPGLGGMI